MSLIIVDCEAFGGAPSVGRMTEFGAVEFKTESTFHGVLWKAKPDTNNPALSRLDPDAVQLSEQERREVFVNFEQWLKTFKEPYVFVSDNNGYDWQWINDGFWRYLGYNPFGHSSRRISDFYAGLKGYFYTPAKEWKRLRVTPHTHHPVDDAMGNVQALKRMMAGERG
jgi:hypothetical protein